MVVDGRVADEAALGGPAAAHSDAPPARRVARVDAEHVGEEASAPRPPAKQVQPAAIDKRQRVAGDAARTHGAAAGRHRPGTGGDVIVPEAVAVRAVAQHAAKHVEAGGGGRDGVAVTRSRPRRRPPDRLPSPGREAEPRQLVEQRVERVATEHIQTPPGGHPPGHERPRVAGARREAPLAPRQLVPRAVRRLAPQGELARLAPVALVARAQPGIAPPVRTTQFGTGRQLTAGAAQAAVAATRMRNAFATTAAVVRAVGDVVERVEALQHVVAVAVEVDQHLKHDDGVGSITWPQLYVSVYDTR